MSVVVFSLYFKISLFVLAVLACAYAVPAGVQHSRPITPHQRRSGNVESEQLTSGADDGQDLKASASHGYGYYSGLGGLGGYYGGYGGYGGLGYSSYPSYGYGSYPYGYSYYSCTYCY